MGTIDLKSGWLAVEGSAITGGEFVVDMNSIKDTEIKDDNTRAKWKATSNQTISSG